MSNIIAVEGMPGAGKTAVINSIINDSLLDNCTALPEVYLGNLSNLSGSKSYLDVEIDKKNLIIDLKNKYENILLDRTFLSSVAYSYVTSKVNGNIKDHKDLIKYFEYLDNKHQFLRPTHLFYLDVAVSESIKRRKTFAIIDEFHNWFDPEFLKYFSEFYRQNINRFGMPECVFIDTTNLKKEEVINIIISVFKK